MENDNSYPRLRALLQKQIVASDLRSSRDLVQSCPLLYKTLHLLLLKFVPWCFTFPIYVSPHILYSRTCFQILDFFEMHPRHIHLFPQNTPPHEPNNHLSHPPHRTFCFTLPPLGILLSWLAHPLPICLIYLLSPVYLVYWPAAGLLAHPLRFGFILLWLPPWFFLIESTMPG
jgi:hypothetical protein